ncbi:MAG: hypothetical protein ACOYWZ_00745 [Bacillota bacterium]
MIIITFFDEDKKGKHRKFVSIKKRAKSQDIEDLFLKKIDERLKKLEEIIDKFSRKQPEYQININNLEVHNLELKELVFRLDNLDIKELSGALNMGNNFGVKVNDPGKAKKNPDSAQSSSKEIKKVHKN